MATLPSQRFAFESKAGDRLDFKSAVTVGADGIFTMTVPAELESPLRGICKKDDNERTGVYETPKSFRVYAPSLAECKELIGKAGKEWAACKVTVEQVIIFRRDIRVGFCVDTDGSYHPNGCGLDSGYRRGGDVYATSNVRHYSIGFAAQVVEKVTYTRESSTKVDYRRSPHQRPSHHSIPETYHDKLNAFCGLVIDPAQAEQVPYTEEAAKFFYEMMIGICMLADRMEQFFAEPGNIAKAIQHGTSPLALPPGKNAEGGA